MKKAAKSSASEATTPIALPAMGLSKWAQIEPFLPYGRETWRKLVRAGKAPQPVRLSETCVAYHNEDVHRYLADPVNYRADGSE